jgi:hypothetical protein
MTNGNFVFDIDGAIAIAVDYQAEKVEHGVKEKFGEEYFSKYCLSACNYPHYVFPGYYAFFKWLHEQGGKIYFFSSGVEERNIELTEKLMRLSFGDDFPNVEYKVFSRQHCVDTTAWFREEEMREKYQSFFYGQKKKKLAGIVVPEEEITNTLLIDDDTSYMVKGEEYNFVKVRAYSDYLPYSGSGAFSHFNKVCYLTGLLSTIFDVVEEKGISLMDAAKYVQIDSEGVELSRDFYYPSTQRIVFYEKGLEILKKIDPTLEFYYEKSKSKNEL